MNSRIRALLFAAPLATLCFTAGTAQAADVASVTIGDGVVRYEGTPGKDELRASYFDGEATFGQITGARITAGPGCEVDERYSYVSCKVPQSFKVVVDFGAGDDQLEGSARNSVQPLEVHGGEGHDQLVGNAGNDLLIGGPGADQLRGHDGDDVLDYQDGGPDSYQGKCGDGNDVLKVDAKGVDLERYAEDCETIEAARALGGTAIGGFDDPRIRFVPEPGLNHDLTISQEGDGLRMTDPNGIDAGVGCLRDRPGDATTVLCTYTKDAYATDIELGDGDDRLRIVGNPLGGDGRPNLIGGEGNDTIEAGPESSTIKGGPGNDVLIGGGGFDDLRGEDGNDRLNGGTEPDKFVGGAGDDQIDMRDGPSLQGKVLGEQGECGAGRDELTIDVSDFPRRECERVASRDTLPQAAGRLELVGGSTLRMSNEKTPSLRVKVRCVGGPCVGASYLFPSRHYILPFHAIKRVHRLEPGQTAVGVMRFGSGFGAFRKYLGKKRKLRMYVATVVGDAAGHTRTVRKPVAVTARRGLK